MNTGDTPVAVEVGPAHHRRVEARRPASCATRSRARRSSPAPRCSGCATGSASSRRRAEVEALARVGARLGRRDRRCPRSPGSARRTGGPRRAASSPASRAARRARTSRARRSRASRCRTSTSCARWSATPGAPLAHAQGRRRRGGQRSADAVPGRRARRRDRRGPSWSRPTALGAAFLAGLGAGVWKDTGDAARAWSEERRFTPSCRKPRSTRTSPAGVPPSSAPTSRSRRIAWPAAALASRRVDLRITRSPARYADVSRTAPARVGGATRFARRASSHVATREAASARVQDAT